MAEVLGAVAAAAQLTATCLALIELTKRINSRTSTLENYQKQLLHLQHISESISSNPLLQTPEIELHTRNIISLLSKQNLEPSLRRNRVSQIILFFSQDRSISRLFIDLERHKATLSLVINEVQSRALHQIQNNISTMSDRQANTKNKASRGKRVAMDDTRSRSRSRRSRAQPLQQTPSSPDPLHGIVIAYRSQPQGAGQCGEGPGDPRLASPDSETASQFSTSSGVPGAAPSYARFQQLEYAAACKDLSQHCYPNGSPRTLYVGCSSYGRGTILNGIAFERNSNVNTQQATDSTGEVPHYVACTAQKGGYTVNGIEVWTDAETCPETYPALRGHYAACDKLPSEEDEEDEETTVVNGIIYRSVGYERSSSGSSKRRK